ncbi:tRNA (uracil-5-)-methyltransferase homolog B isoform X2 [Cuculus canorus]|uniref:tRNA (uracil-5-)-methyltransferase homolog B isoform X2 n=1 Tax=Cuculus canorus TaxID=55661 RepID=UPI0023AA8E0D|nr:tRNA (uracil-5-)-methyltransferase homolog B isoform X2 [Cuculus canorus]
MCCSLGGRQWTRCAAHRGAAPFLPTMALSCALRLLHWHLRPSNAPLSSLPGQDRGVLNNKKIAAKWKEKKKVREGCSLPGSSWEERLANAVTPLWRLPYQEQLQVKYESQRKILQTLTSRLEELGIDAQKPDGLCCPLRPVVPSWYEEFIRCSPLDPCLLFHEGGHWRELVVRTTSRGHTMAIITFHPQELGQEALATQKALLKEFFTCGPGAVCALTSLYFQESTMTRCSHEQSPFQLLHGEPHIFEEVLGLKFRISPDAFFQVNTGGAEVLYQAVRELSQAGGDTVLLDICCGTGTIGLSLAHQVSKIIGIEVVEKAVEDARWNAAFNGISNCEFHSGKAEAVLPQLLSSWEDSQALVAVVNPSRAGLHYRVVRAIRNCKSIRRLLYISCKPEGEAMRNFLELCCPPNPGKKLAGEPFAPTLAIPFDMFPHTLHCEMVLLFTR